MADCIKQCVSAHPNQGDGTGVAQTAGVCLTRTLAWHCRTSWHHAGN